MGTMLDAGHDLSFRGSIGSQFVSDHSLWCHALLLEEADEQSPGSFGVASALDDLVEHVAVLVDRAPQPAFPPIDAHDKFIEMPDIVRSGRLAAQPPGKVGSMRSTPPADRFVRNGNAALEHHLFDFAQAYVEAKIEPDRSGNDLDRKPVVFVGRGRFAHPLGYAENVDEIST